MARLFVELRGMDDKSVGPWASSCTLITFLFIHISGGGICHCLSNRTYQILCMESHTFPNPFPNLCRDPEDSSLRSRYQFCVALIPKAMLASTSARSSRPYFRTELVSPCR